jgi:hypothetical protein
MTTVPGSVFVGHSTHPKKQVLIGVVGTYPNTAVLSISQALQYAQQIRSTCRRLSRLQGGSDDESDI